MRHLDVEQARALRAKYPDWPRWTALEVGDWVDYDGLDRIVIGTEDHPTAGLSLMIHRPNAMLSRDEYAADCQLLPTVGDLLDLAAWNAVVNLGCDGETWAARTIGPDWLTADTPLAALYAAVEAVGGGE